MPQFVSAPKLFDETLGEEDDVLAAFAQGRQRDPDFVQPLLEILAEVLFRHRCFQVDICAGDDSRLDLYFVFSSQPTKRLLLDGLEQLGLEGQTHVSDFVEEQRAPVRQFEQSALLAIGPPIGAFS